MSRAPWLSVLVVVLCILHASASGQDQTKGAAEQPIAVRIAFVGDILMEAPWLQPPLEPASIFANVRETLGSADVTVANLESPLTTWPKQTAHKNQASVAAGRDFILRTTSPDAAQALAGAGIDVVALANNHTMDYTERGLLDTLDLLKAAGVGAVGGGNNLKEAESAHVIEVRNLRIAFLSFSDIVPAYFWAEENRPGIASSKEANRVATAVRAAKLQAHFVVIVFHWGQQLSHRPTQRQLELAQVAAHAGADLVLGAHPHVLQGIGCSGRTPVVYSAGNFAFPSSREVSQRTAIFEIEIRMTTEPSAAQPTVSVRALPALGDAEGRVRMAGSEESQRIADDIRAFSAGLGANFSGDVATCSGNQAPD